MGNLGDITAVLAGTGLYIGNEFKEWSDTRRQSVFAQIKAWGFDFVCPKVAGFLGGSYGHTYFSSDRQLRDWRDWAAAAGLKLVPFLYSVPTTHVRDAQICSEIADACGIVVADMEDEWAGRDQDMQAFGDTFRRLNPDTPIIVTGYGDPLTRFGQGGWPFSAMAGWATGYSPQWYYGVWARYTRDGVDATIDGAAGECGQAFGNDFPLCPSLSVFSNVGNGVLPPGDIEEGERHAKRWKAPIFWWEYAGVNDAIASACVAQG